MSMINREVSDFFVHAYQNGEFKTVTRDDILGGWSVFFFYPADFTFVCPTELSDLQDKYKDFKAAGCEVYSISTDTHFVHKAWHDTSEKIGKITFPMLADPAKSLEVLGWKAEKNLVDMCRDTWNWQKQNPNGYEQ